jgi:hypothetical protein
VARAHHALPWPRRRKNHERRRPLPLTTPDMEFSYTPPGRVHRSRVRGGGAHLSAADAGLRATCGIWQRVSARARPMPWPERANRRRAPRARRAKRSAYLSGTTGARPGACGESTRAGQARWRARPWVNPGRGPLPARPPVAAEAGMIIRHISALLLCNFWAWFETS